MLSWITVERRRSVKRVTKAKIEAHTKRRPHARKLGKVKELKKKIVLVLGGKY
jgi:hypothetical protein